MSYKNIGVVILMGLLLVACGRENQVIQVTRVLNESRQMETALPTPTSPLTSTIQPIVSQIPISTSLLYKLRSPDPEILIDLRMSPCAEPSDLQNSAIYEAIQELKEIPFIEKEYAWTNSFKSVLRNDLLNQVDDDIYRHYEQSIPNAALYLESRFCTWASPYLFRMGIIELINEKKLQFTPGQVVEWSSYTPPITITPHQVNFDDDDLEWILEVDRSWVFKDFIPLESDELSNYNLIPNDIRPGVFKHDLGCRLLSISDDVTRDGIADVIIACDSGVTGLAFSYVHIYSWQGARLQQIDSVKMAGNFAKEPYEYELVDTNNDNYLELYVTQKQTNDRGCDWQRTEIHEWHGSHRTSQINGDNPPDTIYCRVSSYLQNPHQYEPVERISLLENALIELSHLPNVSEDYVALLSIHLAMAYAGQKLDAQAKQILQSTSQGCIPIV